MKTTTAILVAIALFLTGCQSAVKNAGTETVREFDGSGKMVSEKVIKTDYAAYLDSVSASSNAKSELLVIDCVGQTNCFTGKLTLYNAPNAADKVKTMPQPPKAEESDGWKVYRELKEMVIGGLREAKELYTGVAPYKYGSKVLEKAFDSASSNRQPSIVVDANNGAAVALYDSVATGHGQGTRINSNDTRTDTRNRSDVRTVTTNCTTAPASTNGSTTGATSSTNPQSNSGANNCPVNTGP